MVPLIENEVVRTNHWLTQQEFADATALGQLTPGPVLITATFIGYRVAGTLGALVATVAVFLPAFLMTIAAGSSLRRFRSNRQVQAFLRGVTPAVVGLLAGRGVGHRPRRNSFVGGYHDRGAGSAGAVALQTESFLDHIWCRCVTAPPRPPIGVIRTYPAKSARQLR